MHRDQDPKIKEALAILKRELNATRVFLFGSRSLGTHKKNSDYDFVVVTSDERCPRDERIRKVKSILRSSDINADIFVYTEKLFAEWENEFSSIPETAKNTGIEFSL